MYRGLTASVLSTGKPSLYSEHLLVRLGLTERFEENPDAVLAGLRGDGTGLTREYLFALSELSFYHAEQSQNHEYYLASAVYAWAFLFAEPAELTADPLDPRVPLAANLYNVGLAQGLGDPESEKVLIEQGTRPLPFGSLEISLDPKSLLWSGYKMSRFISTGEFKVRGLLNRYRQAGIGLPLAAELEPAGEGPEAEAARKRIPPKVKVPVTALIRIDDVSATLASGKVPGQVEIYTAEAATTVDLGGRRMPLEYDPSAALAYQLEGAAIWDTELGSFFSALRPPSPESLLMLHPYRPGRVPVVLVHGTASSPARWADIVNELGNDPKLRDRIDFWLFTYNTSNPILLSASDLRAALRRVIGELDPLGRDPALRQIVMVGHSQGGLLTRLMVTDIGTRAWDALTDKPFEEVQVSPEAREVLQRALFFEPLPFVTRVVFVATPHGGSFRVSSFVLSLLRRIITLPVTVVGTVKELAEDNPGIAVLQRSPNAVEGMRPGSPLVRTLKGLPIAPGVKAHSIIPVVGDPPPNGQNDTVVTYESAHLEGVDSEKVVYHSEHSTQSNPNTILELRRILYEHLGIACGLECEVPERVDAAVAAERAKQEAAQGDTTPARKP